MDLKFERIEHNILFDLLCYEDICRALAYLADFNIHKGFETIAHKHSIEITNSDITICVIIFVGFEVDEYKILQFRDNLHLVSFSDIVLKMEEFKDLKIKIIEKESLLFKVLSMTNDHYGQLLNSLKNLRV